jgi:uncharacterized membrane-anchored protein YjiN (DUF445 family)
MAAIVEQAGLGADAAREALSARRLARAKAAATALLALAVVMLVTARVLEPRHAAFGYLGAFAEAAIIGALADWYAVVVLFRNPLGLKLPHTAIIPANHLRIAENLGTFIEQQFLAPKVVAEKLDRQDFAGRIGAWLADKEHSRKLADVAARLLPPTLEAADTPALRTLLARIARSRLGELEIAPIAAEALDTLTREGRHHALFDEILEALHRLIQEPDTAQVLREKIRAELPTLFNFFRADAYVLRRLLASAYALLEEVRNDRKHSLRAEFDAFVQSFIDRLKHSPEYREKVEGLKRELLDRPEVEAIVLEFWQRAKRWVLEDVGASASQIRVQLQRLAADVALELGRDPALRTLVNRWVAEALQELMRTHRGDVARFITDQVKGWDTARLTRLIELNIGKDLQYIRINGTFVGGALGLIIHAVTQFAAG